ncbi:hypothetical protein PMKS-000929 [Pichia membranifaciens]|uniref:Uncharacterized protein n=1 Tax=Pichia membranifaciens TaxID=4926 RepID=A0A1Q2YD80_9ASCO|nr:hypothetical protein PMKS-000929 [Pichia membranifaciens]
MANVNETGKSKPDADDWRNIDCWVEDDFDANELIKGLDSAGLGVTQDNEDAWADWSGDEGPGEGKVGAAAKSHDNNWISKGKAIDDPMEKSWRKASKLEKALKGRKARGEESGRRRGKEPDLFSIVRKEKKMDEMSSAFARLMPVAKWQPATEAEDARGEAEEEYDDDDDVDVTQDIKLSTHSGILPHVHEERLRLIQPKQAKEEEPRSRRHRSRHRKSKSVQKEKSPLPNHAETTHPVRIRYSEEPKQSAKGGPAAAKEKKRNEASAKEVNSKRKPVLESKWAAPGNGKAEHPTAQKREQYRQKKIASQLDWDNGVKGTADDHVSAKEAEHAKPVPSLSMHKQQQHQHFAYENSEPPASKNETPKTKAKSKLTSMWA